MGIFRLAILKQKVWYIDSWVEIKLTGWFGIIIMSRMGRSVCTSQQRNYSYYSPFPSHFHISICTRSLLKLTWKSIQNAWEWLDVGFPMSFLLGSVPFLCSCWSSSWSAKAQKPLESAGETVLGTSLWQKLGASESSWSHHEPPRDSQRLAIC